MIQLKDGQLTGLEIEHNHEVGDTFIFVSFLVDDKNVNHFISSQYVPIHNFDLLCYLYNKKLDEVTVDDFFNDLTHYITEQTDLSFILQTEFGTNQYWELL